jgi:hypothetical protein
MIGLFQVRYLMLNMYTRTEYLLFFHQEHGPCRVNNQSTAFDYNPESWNDYANM